MDDEYLGRMTISTNLEGVQSSSAAADVEPNFSLFILHKTSLDLCLGTILHSAQGCGGVVEIYDKEVSHSALR